MDVVKPSEFWTTTKRAISNRPCPASAAGSQEWTEWFADLMQDVGRDRDLYCWNKASPEGPSECMQVDHVFLRSTGFGSFPVVAVEHENRGAGTRKGELPDPHKGGYVEWALWKTLALRSHLGVLVAYPYASKEQAVLEALRKIAAGFVCEHRTLPASLALLCWWRDDDSGPAVVVDSLYNPYVLSIQEGQVSYAPLQE